MEGYQFALSICELGSHFHHGHVSEGPPIIPDSRISRVRFETLAIVNEPSQLHRGLSAGTRTPRFPWFTHCCVPPHTSAYVGSESDHHADDETASVQSPFAQSRRYLDWEGVCRLLGGHYSSVFAHMDSCANPIWLFPTSAFTSIEKSLQVATSPCCQWDLPDVISANLSSDAWSLTTAGSRSAFTCFFLHGIGLPQQRKWVGLPASTREYDFSRKRFSRLQTFLYVQASEFARLPDRSYRRAITAAGQLRLLRPSRACFVTLHASDMLAARIQAIGGTGTLTPQDSQPCRLLPSVYASTSTSRCRLQDSRPGWIRYSPFL